MGAMDICNGHRTAESYNIADATWNQLPDLTDGRYWHASCALKQYVYTFCGKNKFENFLKTIERLDMSDKSAQNRWQTLYLNFPRQSSPYCIYGMSVEAVNDNEILIMGQPGFNRYCKERRDLFVYNVAEGSLSGINI